MKSESKQIIVSDKAKYGGINMEKYALISVSNKTNLEALVSGLTKAGYSLIGTTSTTKAIKELGYMAKPVEEITSFPEMLDGRVKTLQPEIYGGVLADLSKEKHVEELKKHGLNQISVVVCNLYPFESVVEREKANIRNSINDANSDEEISILTQNMNAKAIENIDIGGVTLIRAASKNYKHVSVLCDPSDYQEFVEKLENNELTECYRRRLAMKGFTITANYDKLIADFFMEANEENNHLLISAPLNKKLRYGENPHQKAHYFEDKTKSSYALNTSEVLHGKELSYNNLLDIDAAYHAIYDFETPCAVALKHNTPCGIGFGSNLNDAYEACYKVDPVAIFGGIVIFNGLVEESLAVELNKTFLEVVIAPDYTKEALEELKKKKNLRIIKGNFDKSQFTNVNLRSVVGGYLTQKSDSEDIAFNIKTKKDISPKRKEQLLNLFKSVKNVKSNAIIIGQEDAVLGISGGMVSRIDATRFALDKALRNEVYDKSKPLILASDGFFPFNDIIDIAIENNIESIIQPGGSLNDTAVVEASDEHGIDMVFTGIRFFRH